LKSWSCSVFVPVEPITLPPERRAGKVIVSSGTIPLQVQL